jgi:hypothetical protein
LPIGLVPRVGLQLRSADVSRSGIESEKVTELISIWTDCALWGGSFS